jgi:hypothetical protein
MAPRTLAVLIPALALALGCRPLREEGFRMNLHDTATVNEGVDFRGWKALVLRNSRLEAVVVPAIGRVVALRLLGGDEAADPFWLHPRLSRELAPDDEGWINFGGDKAWPAPQSDWKRIAGRSWPPPATFDARPYTATVRGSIVRIESEVDPGYGIRIRRDIELVRDQMFVDTTYTKETGPTVRVAVWTITQLASPDRIFLFLPKRSTFPGGYRSLLPAAPKDVALDGRLLSLARDPGQKTMLASDAEALVWLARGQGLFIQNVPRGPARPAEWPGGAHAQVYTSPDGDQPYVELELLGSLEDLAAGGETSLKVRYQLQRRHKDDPAAEAREILARNLGNLD